MSDATLRTEAGTVIPTDAHLLIVNGSNPAFVSKILHSRKSNAELTLKLQNATIGSLTVSG